jgi:hypothetical protein
LTLSPSSWNEAYEATGASTEIRSPGAPNST